MNRSTKSHLVIYLRLRRVLANALSRLRSPRRPTACQGTTRSTFAAQVDRLLRRRCQMNRRSRKLICEMGSTHAFSLVEVTLALGIAAFCLIAVFALMPVGVQTNRNATSQTAVTNMMAAVVADLRATPKSAPASSHFGIAFGTDATRYFDNTGQGSTSRTPDSRYRLIVTWNGSPGLRYADLKVTSPAAADPANAGGSTEIVAAFDRN